jgi:hypothetical protein
VLSRFEAWVRLLETEERVPDFVFGRVDWVNVGAVKGRLCSDNCSSFPLALHASA